MGAAEINTFLSHLAVERNVAASTRNQAFATIVFLYQKVFQLKLGTISGVTRAKRPERLPVVLTKDEARRVLAQMDGTFRLMALLRYGSGLRLLDWLRLRVKDIDFALQ